MCRDVECAEKFASSLRTRRRYFDGFRRPIVLLEKEAAGAGAYQRERLYRRDAAVYAAALPAVRGRYRHAHYDERESFRHSHDVKNDEAVESCTAPRTASCCTTAKYRPAVMIRCAGCSAAQNTLPAVQGDMCLPDNRRGGAAAAACLRRGAEGELLPVEGSYVFQSQHIGDLKNLETLENYTDR